MNNKLNLNESIIIDEETASKSVFCFLGEFGYEMISWIPYLLYLKKTKDVTINTISRPGSKPFYYFSDNHFEVEATLIGDTWGNPKHYLHIIQNNPDVNFIFPGIDFINTKTIIIDGVEWENKDIHTILKISNYLTPDFSDINYNLPFQIKKPFVVINNKYFRQWFQKYKAPINYFDKNELEYLFDTLFNFGYSVIYNHFIENTSSDEYFDYEFNVDKFRSKNFINLNDYYKDVSIEERNKIQLKLYNESSFVIGPQGGNLYLPAVCKKDLWILMRDGEYLDYLEFGRLYNIEVNVFYEPWHLTEALKSYLTENKHLTTTKDYYHKLHFALTGERKNENSSHLHIKGQKIKEEISDSDGKKVLASQESLNKIEKSNKKGVKPKFMQIHTFYEAYLNEFYKKSDYNSQSFVTQIEALEEDYFSGSHIYTPYLKKHGYETQLVIANAMPTQNQWLLENGIEIKLTNISNMLEIVRMQVEIFKPDVLYLSDPINFDSKFILSLSYKPKFIFGWRASSFRKDNDWSEFDLIISSHNFMKPIAEALKAKSFKIFKPGFPISVNKKIDTVKPLHDVVFIGQLVPGMHYKREQFINYLIEYFKKQTKYTLALFIDSKELDKVNPSGSYFNHGAVFGLDYYKTIKSGKINLNFHGDIAGTESGNMRMFEVTGCGSLLLTDHFDNVDDMFKIGEELDTFISAKELIEKIEYYLDNEELRQRVANAGQMRCLKDYSIELNSLKLDVIIRSHLSQVGNTDMSRLTQIEILIKDKKHEQALSLLGDIKAKSFKSPNVDYYRGLCFLGMGQLIAARQAFLEELRFYPNNEICKSELSKIKSLENLSNFNDPEFEYLYLKIFDYTMVGVERLFSLFTLAKRVCQENLPGDFVECGVAAGGSSALLAYVINKYSLIPRYLHCCDSFEGMPEPSKYDLHNGMLAEDSGWGTGTCSAPESSLLEIATKLGVENHIQIHKGYFNKTLPDLKSRLMNIAFLHMDGDWYESTLDILNNLYDKVGADCYIQIDDYGFWEGCKKAVDEYIKINNLNVNINQIDSTGVWFQKNLDTLHDKTLLLNLGCGNRFHKDWINIDFKLNSPLVKEYNLNNGIPLDNNSCDVVYHSHVLEHFTKPDAIKFIQECYRVLKKDGILRVVVPDLERIAREYINSLSRARLGDEEAAKRYDWIMLEMYDQTVRNISGGEILKYWRQPIMPAEQYVIERMGSEVKQVINSIKTSPVSRLADESQLSNEEIGRFRRSGEIHQWMYDNYSLSMLLTNNGFGNIKVCSAYQSEIPNFNSYYLDVEPDGSVRKPDSLFMEARKV